MIDFTLEKQSISGEKPPRPKKANGLTLQDMVLNVLLNKQYRSASGIKQAILFKYNENVKITSISSALSALTLQGKAKRVGRGLYGIIETKELF